MLKITSILILLSMACYCNAVNPGLVTAITLPIINKARDKYFELVFQTFGHQVIPDVSSGDITIRNIVADLANASPNDLQVSFDSGSNSIRVDIAQTTMNVQVDWHYSKSIISVSGDARVYGTLDGMGMNIPMTSVADGEFIIPQIGVENFGLNFNKDNFGLDFHCSGCPGFVEDLIKSFMKDTLLDTVRDQINAQVPSQLNTIGNQILLTSYPRTVNIYENFGFASALTDRITVTDTHLEVPIDATVFRFDQGFSRPGDAGDMPHYNAQDPGEILLFINNYLLDTFKATVDSEGFKYITTILGYDLEVDLATGTGLSELKFEEGDFSFTANPTIMATSFGVGLQLSANAKFNPTIKPGDAASMFFVTPTIKSLSMSNLNVIYSGQTYDISFIANYLNGFLQGVINTYVIPTISIPKFAILPLQVVNSELDFHGGYAELGDQFEFSSQ